MTETKKRGPGAPRGRRPRSFICVAVKDGALASKDYKVPDQEPDSSDGSFPKEVATAQFKEEFGIEPEKVWGPILIPKTTGKSTKKVSKKAQDLSEIKLSGPALGNATYNGWKGKFFPLDNSRDEVLFVSVEETSPSSKKRNPPPAARVNKADLIQSIKV